MDSARIDSRAGLIERLQTLAPSRKSPDEAGFGERIRSSLAEANQLAQQAEQASKDLASGRVDSVETVLALSKAELALRHVVTVRNRVIEAYQDIMRLQL